MTCSLILGIYGTMCIGIYVCNVDSVDMTVSLSQCAQECVPCTLCIELCALYWTV